MIKRIWMISVALMLWGMAWAQDVRIKGKIAGYHGGEVYLIYIQDNQQKEDLLKVNPDGTFEHSFRIGIPGKAYLSCMDEQSTVHLFVARGMAAELDISFRKGKEMDMEINVPVVDYSGDHADCFRYLEEYEAWKHTAWPFERMDTLTFAQFRELLLEDLDLLRYKLKQVEHPAFRAMMKAEIGNDPTSLLLRWAWSAPREDEHFVRWIETLDRNNPRNLEFAFDYLRWYERLHPLSPSRSYGRQHLENMQNLFDNQEVINALAQNYMRTYLSGFQSNMDETWKVFQQVSTDTSAINSLKSRYEFNSRLAPGKKAPDFEMTGNDGKVYKLSDFRGKVLYIDVWATWCGPCCMEIPYMEKLVEHYGKNSAIEFISISLDANVEKWHKKLAEDRPSWRQFIIPDNFNSTFAKEYNITGIPRFMVFDKKGRIINTNAPRPSEPEIEAYLQKCIR